MSVRSSVHRWSIHFCGKTAPEVCESWREWLECQRDHPWQIGSKWPSDSERLKIVSPTPASDVRDRPHEIEVTARLKSSPRLSPSKGRREKRASANNTLPANARQIMYAARKYIQERTGKQLNDTYFTQTLLPDCRGGQAGLGRECPL